MSMKVRSKPHQDLNRLKHAQSLAESKKKLESSVPSTNSWQKFAAIFHPNSLFLRDRKSNAPVTARPHGGTVGLADISEQQQQIVSEESQELQQFSRGKTVQSVPSPPTPVEASWTHDNEDRNSFLPASAVPQSGTIDTLNAIGSKKPETPSELAVTHDVSRIPGQPMVETGNGASEGVQTTDAEVGDNKPSIARNTLGRNDSEAGQDGLLQDGTSHAASTPKVPQAASAMATTSLTGTPSTFTKGKEPVRKDESNSLSVRVPRTRRFLPIKVLDRTAQSVLTEASAADRQSLKKFIQILRSKKDQIELFGQEIPTTRCSLVKVIEGDSPLENYICIRGLKSHAEITDFHLVVSRDRYKKLYEPLRLCYEPVRIDKVGMDEPHIVASSSQNTARSKQGLTTVLSPVIKSTDPRLACKLLYSPILHDETYTGALFQSLVDGRPWISTLGGVIEIDDNMYIMACEHAPASFEPSTKNISLADTLLEEDYKKATFSENGIQANTEKLLIFKSADFSEGLDVLDIPEADDMLPSIDEEWKKLSLDGTVAVGLEWCLFPVRSHSILPNFIEDSTKDAGSPYRRKRHYLDQIAEPQGRHTARIATNIEPQPSGIVLPNSSFIVGGGTDELIEVWTVLLDEGHSIQKGDSGSWVVDTSDPVHYKVIGATIATSEDEAYFVRIIDQFQEMEKSLSARESANLASTFGALINCANLAFLKGDVKSDYLIDEALSPYVLEQLHNGWFLAGLKSFLAEYGNLEQHGEPREKNSGLNHRTALRDLLLRYGCELLDSLLDCTDFKKRHANELSTAHLQTLETLEKVLLQARTDELERRQRTAAVKAQSDKHATHTSSSHITEKRQTAPADPGHGGSHERSEHVLWFEVHPKYGNVQRQALLSFFVLVVLAEGVASASGVAAAAVTYLVQLKDENQLADMTMTQYLTLGAVIGPISATVMIVQILLIFSSQTYHWYLFCGSRTFRVSLRGWTRMLILVLLFMASAIARTMLPALYVARRRGLQNDGNAFVAAATAAAPSLLSTASPSIYWNLAAFYSQLDDVIGVYQIIFWISIIGFDSLAGYTFGRMNQSSGHFIPSPSSAAAGATVLSTLTTALVTLPLTHVCLELYRRAVVAQGSSNDGTTELGPVEENVSEKPTSLKPATPHGSSPGTEDLIREKKKPSLDSSLIKTGKAKRYHSDHPARSTSAGEMSTVYRRTPSSSYWVGSTPQGTTDSTTYMW